MAKKEEIEIETEEPSSILDDIYDIAHDIVPDATERFHRKVGDLLEGAANYIENITPSWEAGCDRIFNKGSEDTVLTEKRAFMVGLFQCISMIPGVSRSMATIVGGMSQRLTRKAAAEFSFFLAVPTMLGATVYKVYDLIKEGGTEIITDNISTLLIGNAVAFIVALLAIKFFINFVTKYGFKAFGWYRIVVGALILILLFMGHNLTIA